MALPMNLRAKAKRYSRQSRRSGRAGDTGLLGRREQTPGRLYVSAKPGAYEPKAVENQTLRLLSEASRNRGSSNAFSVARLIAIELRLRTVSENFKRHW